MAEYVSNLNNGTIFDELMAKIANPTIIDSLASEDATNPLSANQGHTLFTYLQTGWIPQSATFTYESADAPIFVVNTASDLSTGANAIGVGYRVKLTQTTAKYFMVHAITSTTITLYGGTDYTLTNAPISNIFYSNVKSPLGFPTNPAKWSTSKKLTTNYFATPTNNTWTNLGVFLSVPIGEWKIKYSAPIKGNVTLVGAGSIILGTTLSTSISAETNNDFTISSRLDIPLAGTWTHAPYVSCDGLITLTAKTPYYLLFKINASGTNASQQGFLGKDCPIEITAVSAYL